MQTFLSILLIVLTVVTLRRLAAPKARHGAPLPPGPPQLPFLGNLFQFPTLQSWKTFAKWGDKWGNIVYVSLLGKPYIIVNSFEVASDMFDRKSLIYSDRPSLTFASEMVGYRNILPMATYDSSQLIRRLFHRVVGTRPMIEKMHPMQERYTHQFLQRLLRTPQDFIAHVRWAVGAFTLEATYGYKASQEGDPLLDIVDRSISDFSSATRPGAYLVDLLPFLRYIPGWVPGFGFQREAVEYANTLTEFIERPFKFVKDQMRAGKANYSYASDLLSSDDSKLSNEEKEFYIKWAAGSLYGGGANSEVSTLGSLFLVMTLFPEAQKKAQSELDLVVGDRLPTFEDMPHLPYMRALVSELLRWHPVLPLGIHMSSENDIHDGYLIPQGALVIANIWWMLHDPKIYPEPEKFNPDRFIAKDDQEASLDPRHVVYGFGRRICPGSHLAEAQIFIFCAMTLAVFNITNALDENGVPIVPRTEFTSGIMSYPEPFKCSVRPRSERAEALILSPITGT